MSERCRCVHPGHEVINGDGDPRCTNETHHHRYCGPCQDGLAVDVREQEVAAQAARRELADMLLEWLEHTMSRRAVPSALIEFGRPGGIAISTMNGSWGGTVEETIRGIHAAAFPEGGPEPEVVPRGYGCAGCAAEMAGHDAVPHLCRRGTQGGSGR